MSRREPASSMQWEAFRFARRPDAPSIAMPEAAPEPADWSTFRFPTCEDEQRLRRHGMLPEQDADGGGDTDSDGAGDSGTESSGASGSGGPATPTPPRGREQVPAPASRDWEYDASGVRLVNCRLGKTMALARIDTVQKLDRLLAAAGAASSLAQALDRASLDVHGVPVAALRSSLPADAILAWASPPRQRSLRRPH